MYAFELMKCGHLRGRTGEVEVQVAVGDREPAREVVALVAPLDPAVHRVGAAARRRMRSRSTRSALSHIASAVATNSSTPIASTTVEELVGGDVAAGDESRACPSRPGSAAGRC